MITPFRYRAHSKFKRTLALAVCEEITSEEGNAKQVQNRCKLCSEKFPQKKDPKFNLGHTNIPENIRLDEDVLKTSFVFIFRRHLQDVSRRLDQDKYIRHSHTSLDVWSRSIYLSLPYVFKTSSRRFQDVFKTSSRCLAKTSLRRLQNALKTSCKNVFKKSSEDVFKSSARHLQDVLQKYLQDVFKTYHQVKLFLLASLGELFNTFLRHTAKTVFYRSICLGPISEKFMIRVQNLQER